MKKINNTIGMTSGNPQTHNQVGLFTFPCSVMSTAGYRKGFFKKKNKKKNNGLSRFISVIHFSANDLQRDYFLKSPSSPFLSFFLGY